MRSDQSLSQGEVRMKTNPKETSVNIYRLYDRDWQWGHNSDLVS